MCKLLTDQVYLLFIYNRKIFKKNTIVDKEGAKRLVLVGFVWAELYLLPHQF